MGVGQALHGSPPTSRRYPHFQEVPPLPGSTPTSRKYPHFQEVSDPPPGGVPSLPGLTIWEAPLPGRRYVVGADPAEGNPNSDESAATILDAESWAQVAELTGKIEPSTFAAWLDELGRCYNGADVMAERNNHGHLLIRELQRLGNLRVLDGYDGRPGWLSTVKGKPLLYGLLADAVRDAACTIRGSETAAQLASIEASTLRAPQGLHDDRADAFALAIAALAWKGNIDASTVVAQVDPLAAYDRGNW